MNTLFNRLLPPTVTNVYQGYKIALHAFLFITLVTLIRSLIHTFTNDGGAQSIASIPLDRFTTDGADAVVFVFSLWGLSQLLMGLLYLIVYLRYRALVSLMYCFIIAEYVMRLVIGQMKPIVTESTAPGEIGNYVMIPLALVLLALSLIRPTTTPARQP